MSKELEKTGNPMDLIPTIMEEIKKLVEVKERTILEQYIKFD